MKNFLLYFGATAGFGILAVGALMFVMQNPAPEFVALPVDKGESEVVPAEVAVAPAITQDRLPKSSPTSSAMLPRPVQPAMKVTDLASVPLPQFTEFSGRSQKNILNRLSDRQIQNWFPDGDRLVVLHLSHMAPSRITVVDVLTGLDIWSLQTDQELRAAAVSADGTMIAIADRGARLTCYDAATGKATHTIDGPPAIGGSENVMGLRFDKSGQKIITAHYDRTVRMWDIATNKELSRLQVGGHQTHPVGFAGPWLHTISSAKHQWWAVNKAEPKLHFEVDRKNRVAELSADGRFAAIKVGNDISILNVKEDSVHRTLSVPDRDVVDQRSRVALGLSTQAFILGGSFSADGTRFAASTSAAANIVWDVESGDVIYNEPCERPAMIRRGFSEMLSPGGRRCLWPTYEGRTAVATLDSKSDRIDVAAPVPQVDWRATQATAFSCDGQTEAVALVGGGIEVRDTVAGKIVWSTAPLTDVTRPIDGASQNFVTSDISAFSVSNGATFVIATTHSGDVIFVTRDQPQMPLKKAAQAGEPLCVALSPDNRYAMIATIDGCIVRVDVDSTLQSKTIKSETLATTENELLRCSAIAIDSTSRTVALGLTSGTIELRSLTTFSLQQTLTGGDGPIRNIAFSEDGRQIGCATYRGTAFVWDIVDAATPKVTVPWPEDAEHLSSATTVEFPSAYHPRGPVRFSHDGARLFVGRLKTIDIVSTTNGEVLGKLDFPGDLSDLEIRSSDDHWLVSRAWGEVYEWLPTAKESLILKVHQNECRFVQFTPDGSLLISGGEKSNVNFIDLATGNIVYSGKTETGGSLAGAVSPDGTKLAICGYATGIEIWDIPNRKSLGKYYGHKARVLSVAFSPDSRLVGSGSEDGTVRVRDVATKKHIQSFQGHVLHPTAIGFSRDGRFVLSATSKWQEQDKNGIFRVWDTGTGKIVTSVSEPFGQVQGLGFSPFDNSIAVTVANRMLTLRDVDSCQVINQFTKKKGLKYPRYLLYGRLLVFLEHPSTIHVRDVVTGNEVATLRTKTMVFALATLPDGNVIAAACEDGTVHVWRLGQ